MIRRYSTPKPSRGTPIPQSLRSEVLAADGYRCVGPRVGMPGHCFGALELDHVRASHATGMKSATERSNLVLMCSWHHRDKTLAGRKWRPRLLDYVAGRDAILEGSGTPVNVLRALVAKPDRFDSRNHRWMPPCGKAEGTDSCWLCGKPRRAHPLGEEAS